VAVTKYIWAVYGAVRATGKHPLLKTYGTLNFTSDHEGFKRSGLKPYSDDSELAVAIQSRALEAFVVAREGTVS
jgi:hypothetical protein